MNTSPRGTEPLDLVKEAVRLLYKANYHGCNGATWKAIQLLETLISEANDER